ncbi:MAG: hypothetical protein WAK92_07530 [Thiobacillus sp.]
MKLSVHLLRALLWRAALARRLLELSGPMQLPEDRPDASRADE